MDENTIVSVLGFLFAFFSSSIIVRESTKRNSKDIEKLKDKFEEISRNVNGLTVSIAVLQNDINYIKEFF
ncbi:hypothetical protein [Methanosarcina horonobensis]|nr:hypothetical protein [Methanosarcina horonobensis]